MIALGFAAAQRFIPAHAGNTLAQTLERLDERGSSPRTRGTLDIETNGLLHQRFIPAHAGNTTSFSAVVGLISGSSPRTRGTLQL